MSSYLQKRGQCFYYRIKVPSDLSHVIPSLEVKRSLKTTDKRAATTLATAYHSKVQNVFALLRAGTVSAVQLPSLLSSLLGTDKSFQVIEAPISTVPSLSKLIDLYQQEKTPKWSVKTKLEFSGIFSVLTEIIGDKPIDRYSREDAVQCREAMLRVPANYKKRSSAEFKSLRQIIEDNNLPTIQPKTVNKHLVLLSSVFKYAVQNGHISTNPVEGLLLPLSKDVQSERKAYSQEDIQRIVANLPRLESEPEKFWVPMIAMYSGMRLDEVCQLHTEDIIAADGILCFSVHDAGERKVKTSASKRLVPLHPALTECGFLTYVEGRSASKGVRLWPNLAPNKYGYWGKQLGNWYGRFNRKHVTNDRKKCFHSFRHTVADTLKQQGVNPEIIGELLGHANSSITTGRYGKRFNPPVLFEAVTTLNFNQCHGQSSWCLGELYKPSH